jgi:hypothetical protein
MRRVFWPRYPLLRSLPTDEEQGHTQRIRLFVDPEFMPPVAALNIHRWEQQRQQ